MKPNQFLKLTTVKRLRILKASSEDGADELDANGRSTFTRGEMVVIRPHRSYYQQLDSDSSASDDDQPSSDNLWRAVINDIREKSGNVWLQVDWFCRHWDFAGKKHNLHMGHRELVLTDWSGIIEAEAIEDHADIISFPLERIGLIPLKPSDFYYFRNVTIEETTLTSHEHDICYNDCTFSNRYMSDHRRGTHVRWCDTCALWFHEGCAGHPIPRSSITPSDNQLYLALDAQREKNMPPGVQTLLRWPICRVGKEFTVKSDTFWYPYSMELAVKMARDWYHSESKVPDDWEAEVLSIRENDFDFMWEELQALLSAPAPSYYLCPQCASYI